jgi:predicted small secreted protein
LIAGSGLGHRLGLGLRTNNLEGRNMKTETIKKLAIVALITLVAACNTVQGAGKDVESIGKAGERTLKGAKSGM